MKYFLMLMMIPQISMAELIDCGEYEVRAIVRAGKVSHEIIVNEKTLSQLTLSMSPLERLKLAPYVDMPISATVVLNQKFDGSKGEIDTIVKIENRIPDPMKPGDTGLKLVKKMSCKKS